jgi:hypothetical protein
MRVLQEAPGVDTKIVVDDVRIYTTILSQAEL